MIPKSDHVSSEDIKKGNAKIVILDLDIIISLKLKMHQLVKHLLLRLKMFLLNQN